MARLPLSCLCLSASLRFSLLRLQPPLWGGRPALSLHIPADTCWPLSSPLPRPLSDCISLHVLCLRLHFHLYLSLLCLSFFLPAQRGKQGSATGSSGPNFHAPLSVSISSGKVGWVPCLQLSKQRPFPPLQSFTHSPNTLSLGLALRLALHQELRAPDPTTPRTPILALEPPHPPHWECGPQTPSQCPFVNFIPNLPILGPMILGVQ